MPTTQMNKLALQGKALRIEKSAISIYWKSSTLLHQITFPCLMKKWLRHPVFLQMEGDRVSLPVISSLKVQVGRTWANKFNWIVAWQPQGHVIMAHQWLWFSPIIWATLGSGLSGIPSTNTALYGFGRMFSHTSNKSHISQKNLSIYPILSDNLGMASNGLISPHPTYLLSSGQGFRIFSALSVFMKFCKKLLPKLKL